MIGLRPFFSYYGAKYTVAGYAGPPRRNLVIEPFCGSAAYSTRYAPRRAALYDINPDICDLWDWLIHRSEADVRAIPDQFESFEEVDRLARGPNLLVRFWVSKGRAEPSGKLSPWYFQYRNAHDCRVWGPAVKKRIVAQKPAIRNWTIDNCSYRDVPLREAHWHVDPPYNNLPGSRYPFSDLDYEHLGAWCANLPGSVDVFENEGAKWAPFENLCEINTTRGKKSGHVSREVIARFENKALSVDPYVDDLV